jgi:hypothetical protein
VDEKPKGETVDYDKLIQDWREGRVKQTRAESNSL